MLKILDDTTINEEFRIKFYFDTNILTYLVDNNYDGINYAVEYLNSSHFANLVSSRYVIFEFIDVRKRQHYSRMLLSHDANIGRKHLREYQKKFNSRDVLFEDKKQEIGEKIKSELEQIVEDFGIDYENNIMHDGLMHPTSSINISSKVSREDSLVLTSAAWPSDIIKDKFVVIASNDDEFIKECATQEIEQIFLNNSITVPKTIFVRNVSLKSGTHLNLLKQHPNKKTIESFLKIMLYELIIEKNNHTFLGRTIKCGKGCNFPKNAIAFKLQSSQVLGEEVFITVIGKELDFVYNIKVPIKSFWVDNREITTYPFHSVNDVNISFLLDDDETSSLDSIVIDQLRQPGNCLFINPDSL